MTKLRKVFGVAAVDAHKARDPRTQAFTANAYNQSVFPLLEENRELLHKVGFIRGELDVRFTSSQLANFSVRRSRVCSQLKNRQRNRGKLENVLHRFFAFVRINVTLRDEVGGCIELGE